MQEITVHVLGLSYEVS